MEPSRRRSLTLVATILASGIALLDGTIVNVALPAIAEDLGGGLAGQQWVVNAYLLTLGSLLLVGGSLGDLYGQRRIFSLGVAGFGLASLLCALAPTIEALVAARALQGAASALLTPASLAVISAVYDDAQERGAAIGTWTAWGGIATVVGPLAGGLLVDGVGWRWIFLVNVPFVLVTLALIAAVVPPCEGPARPRIDVVGATLCALGLAGPVLALIEQPSRGWSDPLVVAGLVGGALLGQVAGEDRRVAVSLSQLAQVYAGQGKHVEAEPLYLQALKIYQAVHGETHADVAATLNNLGVLHRMYGQYAEAEPLLVRALSIKEALVGPDHPDVALGAANLGQLYVAQGQPAKAEPLYRRALSIRQQALGISHPEVAKTLEDLANVLRKLGRSSEAVALDLQAREIRAKRS